MFQANIVTLHPALFPGPLGASLVGKALEQGIWSLNISDLREFGAGKHRNVDDTPAGGGPGMVMRADILARALDHLQTGRRPGSGTVIAMSPRAKPLTQSRVHELAGLSELTIICGRFEAVDERLYAARDIEELSIGDYILSGGELAAMALLDAIIRLLPGVLGNAQSQLHESHENGLLEYPQYTRPRMFEGQPIPEILLQGDHKAIEDWRKAQSEEITKKRRPDLWRSYLAKRDHSAAK